jgi:hypothetical protein
VRDDALQRGTLELIVGPAVRDPPESDPRGAAGCKLHARERLPPESCDVAHGGVCEREVSRAVGMVLKLEDADAVAVGHC